MTAYPLQPLGETASCRTAQQQIRNVALAGHSGAGKTTLFEALLHAGGALQTAGSVERGTTVSDFDPMEKNARAFARTPRSPRIDHGGIHVNLIDTPGYPDFRGPTLSALAAVETVRGRGQRRHRHRVRHAPHDGSTPRRATCAGVLVVNKIDTERGKLGALLDNLRETFGTECLPINLPRRGRQVGRRLLLQARPATRDFGPVADWHQKIIDQVVEVNEDRDGPLPRGRRSRPVRARNCTTPSSSACARAIWCRSASSPRAAAPACRELLDLAEKLLPNPRRGQPAAVRQGHGDDASRSTPRPTRRRT